MVEELTHGDLVVVGVGVLKINDPRLLHDSKDEAACFSVCDEGEDDPGHLGLEYALPFVHVLVVWVRGYFWVVIVVVDVFKAVKGMSKAGGVFGLQFDEPREAVMIPMVVNNLNEFNDGASDAFDVGVGQHSNHRLEYIGGDGEGVGDLVQSRHGGTGAQA